MNSLFLFFISLSLSINSGCKKTVDTNPILDAVQETEIVTASTPSDLDEVLKVDTVLNDADEEKIKDAKKSTASNIEKPVHDNQDEAIPKAIPNTKASEPVIAKVEPILEKEVVTAAPINKEAKVVAPIKKEMPKASIEEKSNEVAETKTTKASNYSMHDEWDKLLKNHVSNTGKVDYAGIKTERSRLDGYIALLSSNPPTDNWSKNKKLAYWINVYNAYTVKLIIDNYPLKSITDLEGGKPWDKPFVKISGTTYTLNQIENEIIRPRFKEPRIHFAVNCAAVSCPPLANQAFTADNLEQLLTSRTKQFLGNSSYNSIDSSVLKLSKIFEWYKEDFPQLKQFISKYAKTEVSPDAKIEYLTYEWTLNDK